MLGPTLFSCEVAEHYEVIKKFRDNERAKNLNEKLVTLEEASQASYSKVENYLNTVYETTMDVLEETDTKKSKQPGRREGKVERRKKA